MERQPLSRTLARDTLRSSDDNLGLIRSVGKYRRSRKNEQLKLGGMKTTSAGPDFHAVKPSSHIPESSPVMTGSLSSARPQIPKEVTSLCECPICFNTFCNPKSLHCEHHFCKDCLGEIVKFNEDSIPYIRCPTCNFVHMLSEDATLEDLKCQLLMKQILDSLQGHVEPEEVGEGQVWCCKQPVHWYCGDCMQYLCENCLKLHKECWNLTAVRYCRRKELLLPYCTVHQVFQYHGCTTCAVSVCPFCLEKQHKDHLVLSFNEYAEKFRGYLNNKIDITVKYNDQANKLLVNYTDDAKSIIKKKTNEIIAKIHEVEQELLKKAEWIQQDMHSKLDRKVKENQQILDKTELLSKQGSIGVVWGTPRLLEKSPPSTISLQAVQREGEEEDDMYGYDYEQALLALLRNFYSDVEYTSVDQFGNVSKKQMDVKGIGLKKFWTEEVLE